VGKLSRLVLAFFDGLAAVTFMTALGFIATVIYATSAPPLGAAILCVVIAVVALVTIVIQLRRDYEKREEGDQAVDFARAAFLQLSDSEKRVLADLSKSGDVPQVANSTTSTLGSLERTCFVMRDGITGKHYVHPRFAKIVQRLVREWRKEASVG